MKSLDDQIFVGNGIGYLGNAATGIIFPITVIGWGISLLFGDGAAAYLSLSQGRGDNKSVDRAIANSILLSFLAGILLILICYAGGDRILYALGATDATIELTRDYGTIIFIMIPLALVQNTMASIIRADGSPRYAMLSMAVGAVLNIIFDPITIFVWGWGIKGAAYATIFGQFVSFVLCALYFLRSKTFRCHLSDLKLNWKAIKPVIPLGGSSFLTQISIVIVTVVNNKLLVSYGARSEYGAEIPLAAFVVIMKLFQIVLNIAIGIAAERSRSLAITMGRDVLIASSRPSNTLCYGQSLPAALLRSCLRVYQMCLFNFSERMESYILALPLCAYVFICLKILFHFPAINREGGCIDSSVDYTGCCFPACLFYDNTGLCGSHWNFLGSTGCGYLGNHHYSGCFATHLEAA